MAQSKQKFAALLTKALIRIKKKTGRYLYEIEAELGLASHVSSDIIQKWRNANHRLLPSLEQAELAAKDLVGNGGLIGREECEQFLSYAGHPYPAQAWLRLFPRIDSPEPDEYFTGREKEADELLISLQLGRVVSLVGPGGVGKTSLVYELIRRLSPTGNPPDQFSDGILYYNFYGHYSVEDAFRYIADYFGVTIAPDTPLRDTASKAFRNKQALLILDGAEEADNLGKVLEIRDRCCVLVVSRYKHVAHGMLFNLDVLPMEQAVTVLQAWSTKHETGQVFAENVQTSTQICDLIGRLPLALRLAGRYMEQCMVDAQVFLALLMETPLALLHEEERQHRSVSVLLEKSVEKLDEATWKVMAVIGIHSYQDFNVDAVAASLDVSLVSVFKSVGDLVKFSLVRKASNYRYQVSHRLVHTYAREKMKVPVDSFQRMVEFFVKLVEEYSRDYDVIGTDISHILEALQQAFDLNLHSSFVRGASALHHFLEIRGLYERAVFLGSRARQVAASSGDVVGLASSLLNLARVAAKRGEHEQAENLLIEVLTLARNLEADAETYDPLRSIETTALATLGTAYLNQGDLELAEVRYQEGLTLARELGDLNGIAAFLQGLGVVAVNRGFYDMANKQYLEALGIARAIKNDERISVLLQNLSVVCGNMGMYEQAELYLEEGLDRARKIGYRERISLLLANRAWIAGNRGDYHRAEQYLVEALEFAGREIGNQESITAVLQSFGRIALDQGQYEKAMRDFSDALSLARSIGYRERIVLLLINLGETTSKLGEHTQADAYFREGLSLARQIGLHLLIADALNGWGEAYLEQENWADAALAFKEAREMAAAHSMREQAAAAIFGVARVEAAQGNFAEARSLGGESCIMLNNMPHHRANEVRAFIDSLPN